MSLFENLVVLKSNFNHSLKMTATFIDKALLSTRGFKRRPLKREVEEQRVGYLKNIERHKRSLFERDKRIVETFSLEKDGQDFSDFRADLLKFRASEMDFLFSELSRDAVLGALIDMLPH